MHRTFYESIKPFRWHEMKMMKYAQFFRIQTQLCDVNNIDS